MGAAATASCLYVGSVTFAAAVASSGESVDGRALGSKASRCIQLREKSMALDKQNGFSALKILQSSYFQAFRTGKFTLYGSPTSMLSNRMNR